MTSASYPFDLPTGDVVFVTADSVEFRLHKSILSIASPFFNDMFSLTQSSTSQTAESPDSCISVMECSEVFDALMRLVYPVDDPPLKDAMRVERILEAALKYQLKTATNTVRSALRLLITQYPLVIFASACRLRLQEEAQMAAVEWKKRVTWDADHLTPDFTTTLAGACYGEELAALSAGTYFRLLYFLRTNPNPAVNFIDPGNPAASSVLVEQRSDISLVTNSQIMVNLPNTDVILRSRDGVEIYTHRIVLQLASAEKLLDVKSSPIGNTSTYEVDLSSSSLRALVQLCYPFARIADSDMGVTLRRLDDIVQAAKSYNIVGVVNLVERHCVGLVPSNPLLVYFFAKKWGWEALAHTALEYVLKSQMKSPVDTHTAYNWAMEYTTAAQYMELLRRIHLSRVNVLQLLADHTDCSRGWKQLMTCYGLDILGRLAMDMHVHKETFNAAQTYCNGCSSCRDQTPSDPQPPRPFGFASAAASCPCNAYERACKGYLDDKVRMLACIEDALLKLERSPSKKKRFYKKK